MFARGRGGKAKSAWLLTLCWILLAPVMAADPDSALLLPAWEAFRDDIRAGRYLDAHARFGEASRAEYPYPAFARDYHPLTALCGLVLAPDASLAVRLSGHWAELQSTVRGRGAPDAQTTALAVSLVWENDAWHLVAARREAAEKLEANVRQAMRQAISRWGIAAAARVLAHMAQSRTESPLAPYAFREIRADQGSVPGSSFYLLAAPLPGMAGLRSFWGDSEGRIRVHALP